MMNNLFRSAYDGLHGAKIHKNTQREKENPKKITHTSPYFSIRNAPIAFPSTWEGFFLPHLEKS
jgi:hypothetical protein